MLREKALPLFRQSWNDNHTETFSVKGDASSASWTDVLSSKIAMSDNPTLPTETASQVFPPFTLRAEGFSLIITPLAPYKDADKIFFNGTGAIETEGSVKRYSVETFMECYLSDLARLHECLESHLLRLTQQCLFDWQQRDEPAYVASYVDTLLTAPSIESLTWVPLELELQITCSEGEVWYEENILTGAFSLRVMVQLDPEQRRVSVGCEGSVDIQVVQSFCADLRSCVRHYENLNYKKR